MILMPVTRHTVASIVIALAVVAVDNGGDASAAVGRSALSALLQAAESPSPSPGGSPSVGRAELSQSMQSAEPASGRAQKSIALSALEMTNSGMLVSTEDRGAGNLPGAPASGVSSSSNLATYNAAALPVNTWNVHAYGAVGDGMTDDTAALQAALDDAPEGATLVLFAGRYNITHQLRWPRRTLHLVGNGDPTLVEAAPITGHGNAGAMLLMQAAGAGSSIQGISVEGAEARSTFHGAPGLEQCFLRASGTTDLNIDSVSISGKSYGLVIDTCTNGRISNVNINGFLTHYCDGQNFHSGVFIKGGRGHVLEKVVARDIGSCVLTGVNDASANPDSVTIDSCEAIDAQDNGFYISSGQNFSVLNNVVEGTGGTGIKVRGTDNIVSHNSVSDCSVGLAVSGDARIPDEFGANGHGTVLDHNLVTNAQCDGVSIHVMYNLPPRNVKVWANTIKNVAQKGVPFAGIRADGFSHQFWSNTIDGCGGDFAIVSSGSPHSPTTNMDISNNTISNSAQGILLQWAVQSHIGYNKFSNLNSSAVHLRGVSNSIITGNEDANIGGYSVQAAADDQNTGLRIMGAATPSDIAPSNIVMALSGEPSTVVASSEVTDVPGNVEVVQVTGDIGASPVVRLPAEAYPGRVISIEDSRTDASSPPILVAAGSANGAQAKRPVPVGSRHASFIYTDTGWQSL